MAGRRRRGSGGPGKVPAAPKTNEIGEAAARIWSRRDLARLLRRAGDEARQLQATLTDLAVMHDPPASPPTADQEQPDWLALEIINRVITEVVDHGQVRAAGYQALARIAKALVSAVGGAMLGLHRLHDHGGLPLPDEQSEAEVRARLARLAGARPTQVGRIAAPQSPDRAEAARKRDGRRSAALAPFREAARAGIEETRDVMRTLHETELRQLVQSVLVTSSDGKTWTLDLTGITPEAFERLLSGVEGLDQDTRESLLHTARAASSLATPDEVERVALDRYLTGTATAPGVHKQASHSPALSILENAAAWLRRELAGGPRAAREILLAGRAAGHSERTLARARDHLEVIVERKGRGKDHRSVWRMALSPTRATRRRRRSPEES